MNIVLRRASGSVAEESFDRKLREPHFASHTAERVPKDMGRDILYARNGAQRSQRLGNARVRPVY